VIINGGSRSNGRFFAKHLTNAEENERVTLCEIRNFAAQTVLEAFREMEAIALGTQCENYFYHANINPHASESLTPEQWDRAAQALEENLGLTGHARFIVEHQKKARVHRHVIWLRIVVSTMRAVKMTDDYEKHQATARQLEREFRLQSVNSVLGPEAAKGQRPARRPKSWESFRGHKSGIDPQRMKEEVTALYRKSGDAHTFMQGLQAGGLRLVKGDRRDLCIVDKAGHVHSLARRLDGVSVSALRDLTIGLDGLSIPSLAELRQIEQ
jgi:hypothetical protein